MAGKPSGQQHRVEGILAEIDVGHGGGAPFDTPSRITRRWGRSRSRAFHRHSSRVVQIHSPDDVGDVRQFSGVGRRNLDLLNESSEVIRFDDSHDRLDVGTLDCLALAEQTIPQQTVE
jgi:hypothetical protein